MIKKLRQIKNIEEVLGSIGLVYLLILLLSAFLLAIFLTRILFDSLKPVEATKQLPPVFAIESAEAVLDLIGK